MHEPVTLISASRALDLSDAAVVRDVLVERVRVTNHRTA